MIGVRVIVSQHRQPPRSGVLLNPKLFPGIDQKPVPLRFAARVLQRDQLSGTIRVDPKISHGHRLRGDLEIGFDAPQEDSAALGGILRFRLPMDGYKVRGLEFQGHTRSFS